MNIIPIKELKNTAHIEKLCTEKQEPVFITKNGYGRLVVMDIDYYERTMQQVCEADLLSPALDDLRNDRLIDGREAVGSIREKYGI